MRTALPANMKTWPDVVLMLVKHCGGGPIVKQHWVESSRLLGSTQVSVYTHPSPTIIFSPADQGTFSKTAGQSQAYYNTWNWEQGTYDVNHLHISTCEEAVSRVSSVRRRWTNINFKQTFGHPHCDNNYVSMLQSYIKSDNMSLKKVVDH